jgi:hypothetical protein
LLYYGVEVEPFFIEFLLPNLLPNLLPKAVFEAKSTVGAGTKKRLSKGVQRPFKRRVQCIIFVGSRKWSKTIIFRAF